MDSLAEQIQHVIVLLVKMKNASLNIANLEEEKSLVKGCISEINRYLLRLVDTHDCSFTLSIRQNLSEKLQLVFTMLNQLQGVLGSRVSMKHGGDKEGQKKNETDRKDNEASKSGKDKGKGISEEGNDGNPKFSESERITREERDKELDDLNALRWNFNVEEAEAKNMKLVLETHKSLFPVWSYEHLQKEAIDDLNIYWLGPTISCNVNNDVEC